MPASVASSLKRLAPLIKASKGGANINELVCSNNDRHKSFLATDSGIS
jgi:hypothetical protein